MSERSLTGTTAPAVGDTAKRWIGKTFAVGCFGILIVMAMCIAPIWWFGWFTAGGDDTTVSTLVHPSQVVAPADSTCGDDEWLMLWTEDGVQHSTCTHKW